MTVFGSGAKFVNTYRWFQVGVRCEMVRPVFKSFTSLFTILLVALLCSACRPVDDGQFEGDAVVYVIAPLSGARADAGQSMLGGVKLAVEAVNREGGLLGLRLVVKALDDRSDAAAAIGNAGIVGDALDRKERVAGVIGHMDSSVAAAALPLYEELGVTLVTPGAGLRDLSYRGHQLFFRVNANDGVQAERSARFLVEEMKAQRVAVVHEEGEYGSNLAAVLGGRLQALGARSVLQEKIGREQSDFSDILQAIDEVEAEAVYFAGTAHQASRLIGSLRAAGVDAQLLASDSAFLGTVIDEALGEAEGLYVSALAPSPEEWLDSVWVEAYRLVEQRDPGPFSVNGYAAMQALAAGVRAAYSFEGEAVSRAMRGIEMETLLGLMRFSANGERTDPDVWFYKVEGGEFRQVE